MHTFLKKPARPLDFWTTLQLFLKNYFFLSGVRSRPGHPLATQPRKKNIFSKKLSKPKIFCQNESLIFFWENIFQNRSPSCGPNVARLCAPCAAHYFDWPNQHRHPVQNCAPTPKNASVFVESREDPFKEAKNQATGPIAHSSSSNERSLVRPIDAEHVHASPRRLTHHLKPPRRPEKNRAHI